MKNILNHILSHENHLSINGDVVVISGNTKNPAADGSVKSFTITKDQLLYAVLVKGARRFSIDHGNSYKPNKNSDAPKGVWQARPACYIDSTHCFVSSVLKDYPGEGNWK